MKAVKCFAWVAMTALLSACSLLPAKLPAPTQYDFGPVSETQRLPVTLPSLQVTSAPWLETPAIVYRLEYRDAAQVATYRDSRWVAPPAALFAERLRQRMAPATTATTPGLVPVPVPVSATVTATAVPTSARLRVDIEEFCQSFASVDRSRAVVRLRATRLDIETARVVAVKTFLAEAEAETADAAGGVHAMSKAADDGIQQIAAWLSSPTPDN